MRVACHKLRDDGPAMMGPHTPPTAFRPSALSSAVVAALNAAAAHGPAQWPLGNGALSIAVAPAAPPEPDALRLDLIVGGEAASLLLPPGLLAAANLQASGPDSELSALLLETALAEALSDIEAQLGIGLAFSALGPWQGVTGGPSNALGLHIGHGGQAFRCVLHAGPFALANLVAAARRPRRALLDGSMPILACFRPGVSEVPYAELMSLRPGDAVVMEDCSLQDGRVLVVFGERWAAAAHRAPGVVQLDARPGPSGTQFFRRWCMIDGSHDPADADVTELRVTLVFEFGRRMVTLAEVAALGVGSVLETGGGPDQSVDVLANGRRIGRGTVVLVGGAFAVQLHSIHVPGAPAAAPRLPVRDPAVDAMSAPVPVPETDAAA